MFCYMITLQLEDLLKARGKTLYWLASPEGAGVEYGSLWRLKEGRAKSISFDLLDRLCRALECTPGELFLYSTDVETGAKKSAKGAPKKPRKGGS